MVSEKERGTIGKPLVQNVKAKIRRDQREDGGGHAASGDRQDGAVAARILGKWRKDFVADAHSSIVERGGTAMQAGFQVGESIALCGGYATRNL